MPAIFLPGYSGVPTSRNPKAAWATANTARNGGLRRLDLDGFRDAGWLGHRLATPSHPIDVKLDRFSDQSARLLNRAARGHTTRKVRHIGGPVVSRLLKDHR